ncbi:hypothetical protein [Bradyrhizobium sp. G127]|uniref:hypothetical protein n=1 Tax=Bradyrhizobium sp. G127 TaxID=2904800 RepID=UPI001F2D0E3F|nr:hypothetical protein [Bradyrhizobium sp. G127]MCF2522354.1 hypothetical protein [Bradyrhizobium sp. G127]
MDSILVQNGRAHQIWRGVAKDSIPPMTPELMDCVVEAEAGLVDDGDIWSGSAFSKPSPVLGPHVDGETFLARVTDDEYASVIAAAQSNMQLARWLDQLRILGYVNVTSDAAMAAKAALVAAGLLTSGRADMIFAQA